MRLTISAFVIFIFTLSGALAAVGSAPTSQITLDAETPKAKKISVTVDIAAETNLRRTHDPDYAAKLNVLISPSYAFHKRLRLSADLAGTQNLYGVKNSELQNTTFSLTITPGATSRLLKSASLLALLPTNEQARTQESLQGGAGLSLKAGVSPDLFKKNLSIGYKISALKYFHQYEESSNYTANVSYRIRHSASVGYSLSDRLSFELSGLYRTGWTYQNALRTDFETAESLLFEIGPTSTIYASHSTSGNALGANGTDSNISFFDAQNDTWSLGGVFTF